MDKSSETKLVYTYGDDGKYTGTKTLDYTDRSPISGAWQIPASCTEIAPPTAKDGYDIIWNGTAWECREMPKKPEPMEEELTVAEIKARNADKIASKYEPQLTALKDNLVTAMLVSDAELQTEIKAEYTELVAAYNTELEALSHD